MKKVALGLVMAALAVLAACSKSSDSGQNQQYCNSYGQCYNTASANTCGGVSGINGINSGIGYSGINSCPFSQIGNGQCINRLNGQVATPQQCYACGGSTINGTGVNGLYCNQYGLNSNISQFGLPSTGLCLGGLQVVDPYTGITQCAPTTAYGTFQTVGVPAYYGGNPYLYSSPGFHAGFGFYAGVSI